MFQLFWGYPISDGKINCVLEDRPVTQLNFSILTYCFYYNKYGKQIGLHILPIM